MSIQPRYGDGRPPEEIGGSPAAEPRRGARFAVGTVLAAVALGALVLIGVGLAVFAGATWLTGEDLADRIAALGAWGPAAVVALMVLHCFVPFPAELLAMAAGAAYGTVLGTTLIWCGAMVGAALSFALARWLGRPFVEAMLGPGGRVALTDWSADQGAATLLVSRLLPVIAFNLINYAAGLTRVGWWTFLWTTGIGILPLTTLMVWFGSQMRSISWPWLLAVSAAGIILFTLVHRLARRRGWLGRSG